MKLFIMMVFCAFSFPANAQKVNKLSLGFQLQPELTFYRSSYIAVEPPAYSRSSYNIGFNLYGQYQLTGRLFTTLGVGFISRKLNIESDVNLALLPKPYYDTILPYIVTKTISFRVLQIPVGLGYNVITAKKSNVYASLTFVPNFLLNMKYALPVKYPAFKKNYWQGISINPAIGFDHDITQRIQLTSAIAYSVVNTVREEEYSSKHPQLKHQYLQLSLGLKLKFIRPEVVPCNSALTD